MTGRRPINGPPAVILPHALYERCMGWMAEAEGEVAWRGLADWNGREIRINELFLPKQTTSTTNVEALMADQGGDFAQWLSRCIKNGTYMNKDGECRYKWHMHSHPGDDWTSLTESDEDTRNTAKFADRDVDWMLVGRAVPSGKFRVCLEIFRPYRLALDFLQVFAEYNGLLYRISQPDAEPRIENGFMLACSTPATLSRLTEEEQLYYGNIVIKEKAPRSLIDAYRDLDRTVTAGRKGTASHVRRKTYKPYRYRRQATYMPYWGQSPRWTATITSVQTTPPVSSIYCSLKKTRGIVYCGLQFKVGPWTIGLPEIQTPIELPQLPRIRAAAAKEVKEKVAFSDVTIPEETEGSAEDELGGGMPLGGD